MHDRVETASVCVSVGKGGGRSWSEVGNQRGYEQRNGHRDE